MKIVSFTFLCLLLSTKVFAANPKVQEKSDHLGSVYFQSEIDHHLQFRKVSVLEGYDNMNTVYSSTLTDFLKTLLKKETRFNYSDSSYNTRFSFENYAQESDSLKKFFEASGSDIAFQINILRAKKGLSLFLTAYWNYDLSPLAQESVREIQTYDHQSLQIELQKLLKNLVKRFPFDGHILSRDQNRITINLGKSNGLREGQSLSVVEVISLNRHPKYKFVVSSHQRVLGTARLSKVEDYSSFAVITTEVRPQIIQPGFKVSGLSQVEYADWANTLHTSENQLKSEDSVSFGQDAKEWLPESRPTFGLVGARLGIGKLGERTSLPSGSLDGGQGQYMQVGLGAELWWNSEWLARFKFAQGVTSLKNPVAGSPEKLSLSSSRYDFGFYYRKGFSSQFWGPHFEFGFGLSQSNFQVDQASPQSLTSFRFSNFFLSAGGEFSLSQELPWFLGGRFVFHLQPKVGESPVDSGLPRSAQHTEFAFYGGYNWSQRIRLVSGFDFNLYSSKFAGVGSRGETGQSMSIQETVLHFGADYMF